MPSTYQSIVINAPLNAVWDRFSDFHDLSWASNVVSKVDKVGSIDGGEIGAKRILNDAFHETLREVNADDYSLRYSIDEGPSPISRDEVSNYMGAVKLRLDPDSQGTLVEWSSSWESNSEEAVGFCHGIYVALLDDLAKSFE